MRSTRVFENTEFGKVRTMSNEQGEALFCGKDVCDALGDGNPQKAIRDHVSFEDKGVNEMVTPSGTQRAD